MSLSDQALAAEDDFPDADLAQLETRKRKKHPLDNGTFGAPGTSVYDYRKLNMKSTEVGMWAGIVFGAGVTWVTKRFAPFPVGRNGLYLTFILSASSLSFLISTRLLRTGLADLNRRPDIKDKDDNLAEETFEPHTPQHDPAPGSDVRFEPVILQGEEMRDPFFRPGIPRRPA
ncbi:hypothetical protein TREMEDRAFT_62348 [Tremella mesenterica DSM 1558]|uniref:uncharacterized protein n=1 Tax=Tremella mesenterica (strain ATCC 24925 / CBS 8224 / DSM 1558 / NBRC 9311 / NRRL Y-6157 / RJB 2259-6 / UBC 559-6) TaxID=578456 RepID=UPI0003F49F41|nr:uncharacterized protein TREMEDRAFT_62348 [Tremella mesenterica DSM 1558]EIW69487.1 hypothetical protein TREMEDRAFT_62348 [Tremella mesenterica DSM 1558]